MEGEEGLNKDQIVLQIAKEIARGNFSNKNETPDLLGFIRNFCIIKFQSRN